MSSEVSIIKHICIVENNDSYREALLDALRVEGFRASAFMNGLEALAVLDQTHFDLVLSDIEMPEMSGLELLKCIQDRGLSLPVILMTGGNSRRSDMLRQGAAAFLSKPFGVEELMLVLSEIWSGADTARVA